MPDIDLTFDQTCLLIEHVRNKPCLYDPGADYYNNRDTKKKSWISVKKEMNIKGLTGKMKSMKSI